MHRLVREVEAILGLRSCSYFVVSSWKKGRSAKRVLYGLCQGLSEPAFVLKVPYDREWAGRLKIAFDHLSQLMVRLEGSPLLKSIPKPLFYGEIENYPVLVESFLGGWSPVSLCRDRARLRVCASVFAWLAHFGLCTREEVSTQEIQRLGVVHPDRPIAELKLPASIRKYAKTALDGIIREKGMMPLVFVHNDLNPRNIAFSKGRIGLLDWELSRRSGLPLIDGIHFSISTIMMLRNERLWPAFRRFVTIDDALGWQMRYEVRKLGAHFGVKRQWIEGLLVSYLLNKLSTTSEYGEDIWQALEFLCAGGLASVLDEISPILGPDESTRAMPEK
jgi:hypothetical protein